VRARGLIRRWKSIRQDIRRNIALRFVSDRDYLRGLYFRKFGRWPELERPTGFNEKIIVKILGDRRPFMTLFADKLRVRDYVRQTAPGLHLPTLYWWSNRAGTLPFDELPQAFVMKANHGSGWVRVVEDRTLLRRRDLVATGKRWLRSDFTAVGRERAYAGVRRAVYAEELLRSEVGGLPPDYKLFVFGGRVRMVQVDRDRFTRHTQALYDELWRFIPGTVAAAQGEQVDPPPALATMIRAAEQLSAGVDFVRVDLYAIAGKAYFGELTTSPNKGLSPFEPPSLDAWLGSCFRLDDSAQEIPLDYDPGSFCEPWACRSRPAQQTS
jgi:hypothetical protein